MLSFYVRGDDGEEYGPAAIEELHEWVMENRAGVGTRVRRVDEANASWQKWEDVPELRALLDVVHAQSLFPGKPHLQIAPLSSRFMAFVLDLLIVVLPLSFSLVLVLTLLPGTETWFTPEMMARSMETQTFTYGQAVLVLMLHLGILGYFTYFHAISGQTPAKKLFRIEVVNAQGRRVALSQAFLRALVMDITFLVPYFWLFFAFVVTPRKRLLHDLAARTFVVRKIPENRL